MRFITHYLNTTDEKFKYLLSGKRFKNQTSHKKMFSSAKKSNDN